MRSPERSLVLAALGLLFSAGAANADMTYEQFDRQRNSPYVEAYFDGLLDGIKWANSVVWTRGVISTVDTTQVLIYCAPGAITREQAIGIVDRYVAKHGSSPADFLSSILATGLAETFPCAK